MYCGRCWPFDSWICEEYFHFETRLKLSFSRFWVEIKSKIIEWNLHEISKINWIVHIMISLKNWEETCLYEIIRSHGLKKHVPSWISGDFVLPSVGCMLIYWWGNIQGMNILTKLIRILISLYWSPKGLLTFLI